ncbi:MAG: type II toxin-antitoxin system Phd/YefM family antitoxin [Spirochaetota bacterium]
MQYIKYTDFRNKSKEYIDKVEEGNDYIIVRKGKPVAKLIPFNENESQGWKRNIKKVTLKSKKTTLDYILNERYK